MLNWSEPSAADSRSSRLRFDRRRASFGRTSPAKRSPPASREIARESLARGQNLHHPHYVGHQVPAPVPLAALFDLVGSVTNQVMAIYEMGPWATAVEHAVVEAVGERLGFEPGKFAGLVTSGGSLANLTGLLTARNVDAGRCVDRRTGRSPAGAGARRACRCPLLGHAIGRHSWPGHRSDSSCGRSTIAAAWTRTGSTTRCATCARAACRLWQFRRPRAQRRSVRSIRSKRLPMCAAGTKSGCTSMRPTAAQRRSARGIGICVAGHRHRPTASSATPTR